MLSIDVISAPSNALLLPTPGFLPSRLPESLGVPLKDRFFFEFDRWLGGDRSFEVMNDFLEVESCC